MKPSQTYFLQALSSYASASVLDFACATGRLWDHVPRHIQMYGCDIQLHHRLEPRLVGRGECFRLSTDPAKIPFDDGTFDIVFANSAFEHVRPIREIIGECARVLKPGGRLIAVFPCKTVVMEPHVHVPFASWLRPGGVRKRWCHLWRGEGEKHELYLSTRVNYKYYGAYKDMLSEHFSLRDITRELVSIAGGPPLPRWLVSRFYAAAVDGVKR